MAFGGGTALAEKYAAIVIDADTQQVLHDRHADEPRYPASLTKVMTLYMLFDALKSGEVTLDERMTVSRFAASQAPSNLKLRTGSTIRVRDAIGALVTKSANDVAVVVAERLGGTERRFAQLMTVKAKALGLENTRFVNASGLPDTRQLTTARDMALLADAMLTDHADYYHYFATKKFSWGRKTYKNHNNLLGDVDGVDGIKTGYTRASGFNLMASAKRDGHRIIAIMLGGTTARARDRHVEVLLEAAFSSYTLPADDPELRTRLAFAMLNEPLNPEAAAEPMLNGKPLSVILATEAAAQKLAANDNQPAEAAQGDADDTPVAPVLDAPVLVAESAPAGPEAREAILPIDPEQTSIGRHFAAAPALEEPAFSPEEYRRRQLAK
ncbi:MAG TPA: D-alanyl-D-alanine carboxypeptidase [Hyphomonas adhaerens]|uniref:D-alanyl-D-alanine carboxypeptidase n=2 Tax=Hyphomonas adhaerens TaxID=81029 RepID=A0A3B9GYW1_9PROT|nr:D-alanyl-D-alanine carboxypeptidase [Hyphomonas adhaerens]